VPAFHPGIIVPVGGGWGYIMEGGALLVQSMVEVAMTVDVP